LAEIIHIGSAVNDSERWAFAFLEKNLPDSYILVTNLEILTNSGQPMEVDALIIGSSSVFIVDVKGFIGRMNVDANAWTLDGRHVENSLKKANYVARVFAGRVKNKLSQGEYAPWIQGMVFVTGNSGQNIEVVKNPEQLCVFSPDNIVDALTQSEYLTTDYVNTITERQKRICLDVVGNTSALPSNNNQVQDFLKKECLFKKDGEELWTAEYKVGDWVSQWFLKVLTLSDIGSLEEVSFKVESLREDFYRLQQLSEIKGVLSCAPLIDDGEQLVLPIKLPSGSPLIKLNFDQSDDKSIIQLLDNSLSIVQSVHARGCILDQLSLNDVFVTDDLDVALMSSYVYGDKDQDLPVIKSCFASLVERLNNELILDSFNSMESVTDLDVFISDLREVRHGSFYKDDISTIEVGGIVGGRFKLNELLGETEFYQVWNSTHIEGQFDCVVTVYGNASEYWLEAKQEYSALLNLYHPSIEKIIDLGLLPEDDKYFIARAWVPGFAFYEVSNPTRQQFQTWIVSLLNALQYLHSKGLTHKNISPFNIVCSENDASLINFLALPSKVKKGADVTFMDNSVNDLGWTFESDVYSLIKSFVSVMTKGIDLHSEAASKILTLVFGNDSSKKIIEFLSTKPLLPSHTPYVEYFGLIEVEKITEISEEIVKKWSISTGYMTFIVLDMLNDQRPRSRSQWVLNALRSRKISANKINKSSFNSTLSKLKSQGIAQEQGSKLKVSEAFVNDFIRFTQ